QDRGGYDNRRSEGSRHGGSQPPSGGSEEPFVLPGESLAKYRGRPAASSPAPIAEPGELQERQPEVNESGPRGFNTQAPGAPVATKVPRRSSGGLPRWLLAETESASEEQSSPADSENLAARGEDTDSVLHDSAVAADQETPDHVEADQTRAEASLSEEEVDALSTSLVDAKLDEIQAKAPADALVGGADFDDEEDEEETEETEETEEIDEVEVAEEHLEEEGHAGDEMEASGDHDAIAEGEDTIELSPRERAEAEAEAAHEDALHAAALDDHGDAEHGRDERAHGALATSGEHGSMAEDDSILLPGETRAPRVAGAPREEFAPRDSARIGGNPRSRLQRPYRSGGGDRGGRDHRGGERGRGGDRRGGRPGGRPGGRFDRRSGGSRHDRGYHGRPGPSRRPQLISEMLKAGQDVVIQIAKEPLGKK